MSMQHAKQYGATLVEVLVAIALTGIMLPALATALVTSHAGRASSHQQLQANAQLHEAAEAVRALRDQSWSTIATNGTYHSVVSGSTWALASGAETVGGFTRQIVITDAKRDVSGALVTSGGTDDLSTKHVHIDVSWTTPYNGSVFSDMYLARWQNDVIWQQTADGDFASGTSVDATITATDGGQIELADAPNYQMSGTFTSGVFDAGAAAAFNSLAFVATQPAGTSLKLQIATSNDGATWNYVGPDGTGSSYFDQPAPIPLDNANGRYMRYRVFLAGDGSNTPVLSEIEVNYAL